MRKFLENKKNSHGPHSTYSVTEIYDLQRFNIKKQRWKPETKKRNEQHRKKCKWFIWFAPASRQEIKAEVFNYQQINKMETINSIRQFCNEGPVMAKTATEPPPSPLTYAPLCLKL